MISKYHNHTLHTNPQHREGELQNISNRKTPGRQSKATSSLFSIKMIEKLDRTQSCATRHGTNTERKRAKIRNRYNQVSHLTQDTNEKVTNSQ